LKSGELYIVKNSMDLYSLVRLTKGIYMADKKIENLMTEDYYVDFQYLSPKEQRNQLHSLEADLFFNTGVHMSPEAACGECGHMMPSSVSDICTRCGMLFCQRHSCSC
jgi:hypothetical protein